MLDQDLSFERVASIGSDLASVPQHRHAVADVIDLLQPMGNVDNPDLAFGELADELKQLLQLAIREGCRRLVHGDNPSVVVEYPGDLDHLLLSRAEISDTSIQRHLFSERFEQATGPSSNGRPVDDRHPVSCRKPPE